MTKLPKNGPMLKIATLCPGDLLFSTTRGAVSSLIRSASGSKFSHVSIYCGRGVILESNDRGVQPRRIILRGAESDSGEMVGVPYDDWSLIAVVRAATPPTELQVELCLKSAAGVYLGLDYPSMMKLGWAAKWPQRILTAPLGFILSLWELLTRGPVLAPGIWCSQLIAAYLQSAHPEVNAEASNCRHPGESPQSVYNLASMLGYQPVAAAVSIGAAISKSDPVAALEYGATQNKAELEWRESGLRNREVHHQEKMLKILFFSGFLLFALVTFLIIPPLCRSERKVVTLEIRVVIASGEAGKLGANAFPNQEVRPIQYEDGFVVFGYEELTRLNAELKGRAIEKVVLVLDKGHGELGTLDATADVTAGGQGIRLRWEVAGRGPTPSGYRYAKIVLDASK